MILLLCGHGGILPIGGASFVPSELARDGGYASPECARYAVSTLISRGKHQYLFALVYAKMMVMAHCGKSSFIVVLANTILMDFSP
jgi:hypothetical protein